MLIHKSVKSQSKSQHNAHVFAYHCKLQQYISLTITKCVRNSKIFFRCRHKNKLFSKNTCKVSTERRRQWYTIFHICNSDLAMTWRQITPPTYFKYSLTPQYSQSLLLYTIVSILTSVRHRSTLDTETYAWGGVFNWRVPFGGGAWKWHGLVHFYAPIFSSEAHLYRQ